MRPVLFEIFGLPINSYGVSKAVAALVAGFVMARAFRRAGWDPDQAWNIVIGASVLGFVGGKIYYLAENIGSLSIHDFGSSGFTWYGGLIAGTATVLVMARRAGLSWTRLAGMVPVPLSLGYGIGRIGCFLSGDGTYGRPTDLPWGVAFPEGTMPTTVPVHPTALYETLFAFALAALLWAAGRRMPPVPVLGLYAVLSGVARFLVEELRINDEVLVGLTQPQIWSLVLVTVGGVLVLGPGRRTADDDPDDEAARRRGGPVEPTELAVSRTGAPVGRPVT